MMRIHLALLPLTGLMLLTLMGSSIQPNENLTYNTLITNTSTHRVQASIGSKTTSKSNFASEIGLIKSKGYSVKSTTPNAIVKTSTGATLAAWLGVSGRDGHNQFVFFFINGGYLGTDTAKPSVEITSVKAIGTGIAVTYPVYRQSDSYANPTGTPVTITYTWNGLKLLPNKPYPKQFQVKNTISQGQNQNYNIKVTSYTSSLAAANEITNIQENNSFLAFYANNPLVNLGLGISAKQDGGLDHYGLQWHEGNWIVETTWIGGNEGGQQMAKNMVAYLHKYMLPAPHNHGVIIVNSTDSNSTTIHPMTIIAWQEGNKVYQLQQPGDPVSALQKVVNSVVSANTLKSSSNILVTEKKLLTIKGSLQATSSTVELGPDFISASTGFIADKRGLLKTDNGGTSWSRVSTPKGLVQAVDFTSDKVGYVLMALQTPTSFNTSSLSGTFSLYRTHDGGSVWQGIWTGKVGDSLQQGTAVGLQAFADNSIILRVGNRLLLTNSKGQNWRSVIFTGQSLAAVKFTTPENGIVVTVSTAQKNGLDRLSIWSTNDGGLHYTRNFESKKAYYGLDVQLGIGLKNGVVLAWNSWSWDTVGFWTNNGGHTWNAIAKPLIEGRVFPDQPMYLSASYVLLPAGGGAGPLPSSFWVSTDGGKHFNQMNKQVLWRSLQLSQAYGSTIYGLAQAGNGLQLLRSTNSGASWQQVYPSLRPMDNISFVSATQGYGLGSETDASAVLKTNNGGASWQVVGELPSGEQISALTFTTLQDGLAVADQPRTNELQVYQTTNGGHTWSLIKGGTLPKETASVIAGMGLIDPATISVFSKNNWIIGANGYPQLYTLSTINAGKSWELTAQMADPPGATEDFAFAGKTDGWMSVMKTEKSGTTTTPLTSIYRLNGVSQKWLSAWKLPAGFVIEGIARNGLQDGWLVGVTPWLSLHQQLVVYHTTNGGQSWEEYISPIISDQLTISPPPNLTNVLPVEFVNANVGWMLTQNGLLQTTNGGQTWNNVVSAK